MRGKRLSRFYRGHANYIICRLLWFTGYAVKRLFVLRQSLDTYKYKACQVGFQALFYDFMTICENYTRNIVFYSVVFVHNVVCCQTMS